MDGVRSDLPGYRLRSVIGEGGMGAVWSAERIADGADVAIKILKVQEVEQMRRLVREARIAQRLQHDNVVRVHEILASASDAPALVMERLRGESLRERLGRSTRLPLGESARIIVDVGAALEAAHALGIVHRDLKPENVFLHQDAARTVVKVVDFGVAKIVSGASDLHTAGMTRTGAMLGTPYYMAPEQVFGEGDVDAQADVWACGVVLFELLAGRRPFEGENPGQVFKAIAMGAPPALREHVVDADVAAEVIALVDRMLAHDRAARPSLAEVRAALLPFADEQLAQVVVRVGTAAEELAPTVDLAAAERADREVVLTPGSFEVRADPASRFGSKRFGVIALAVVAVLGTVTLLVLLRSPPVGDVALPEPRASLSAAPPPVPSPAVSVADEPVAPRITTPAVVAPKPAGVEARPRAALPAPAPSASAARLPGGVRAENPY